MMSSQTVLSHLEKLDEYLTNFAQEQHSTRFEQLIAQAFSRILYLPFYTSDNDDANISHRVTWFGSEKNVSSAPSRRADAIACAYDFYILIEATQKTGANQWTQEFAQSLRHCRDFLSQRGVQPNQVYITLITTELYEDTYESIRRPPRLETIFVPIEVPVLARILETSILTFTMRHLELRRLLHQISECVRSCSSISDFRKYVDDSIAKWQKDVLKLEKDAFIGVKSYEAMKRIGRKAIGVGEIFGELQKHPTVTQYLDIISDKLLVDDIEKSLLQQSLAARLSPTYDGEELFQPVPSVDFKGRGLRLIKVVEEING